IRLVQRKLLPAAVELVAAIFKPVRPRDQDLAAAGGAHLVRPVAVDQLPAAGGVCAQSTANLDDHGALIAERDFDLLAGWRDHRSPPVSTPKCILVASHLVGAQLSRLNLLTRRRASRRRAGYRLSARKPRNGRRRPRPR